MRIRRGPGDARPHPAGAHRGEYAEGDEPQPRGAEERAAVRLVQEPEQGAIRPGRVVGIVMERSGDQKHPDDRQGKFAKYRRADVTKHALRLYALPVL